MGLPRPFFEWAYLGRAEMVRRMACGERIPPEQLFLGFTRHCPTFVSSGPAGLNGAVKGVGFVPRPEYLAETAAAYLDHIHKGFREGYSAEGLSLLVKYVWGDGCAERLDFSVLGTLELARKHTWTNVRDNPAMTLCFFQPPAVSFEVRGTVEVHEQGPYHTFLNAQHDVYHRPAPERWPDRPAYLVRIREIYDNSASREGFGRLLAVEEAGR